MGCKERNLGGLHGTQGPEYAFDCSGRRVWADIKLRNAELRRSLEDHRHCDRYRRGGCGGRSRRHGVVRMRCE